MNQTEVNGKQVSQSDLPRQKLLLMGVHSLSDAELLAMLIMNGTKTQSALSLGETILAGSDRNLHELGKMTFRDLIKVPGIGEAKALSIISAFEIGRRRNLSEIPKRMKIKTSKEVFQFFAFLADYYHEEFWILLLRRDNSVIIKQKVSLGGTSGTVVDPKIIFKLALDYRASNIVLCHNHPSGNIQPSSADVNLTKKLSDAGKLLDITVIDHMIVGDNSYYSFSDEGII